MKSKNSETPDPHRPWVQLGGDGGRSPLPFFENQKSCPDFGKKCPDSVHLWVKYSI